MITSSNRLVVAVAVFLIAANPITVTPQRRRNPPSKGVQVLEKNVRAELNFLASDALQGRGSGTNYERVAAEYIGSMFQQFGLEPAGDADAAGKKGYVQRIALESRRISEAPSLTVGSGSNARIDEMATMANGTRVEFESKTQVTDSGTTWNAVGVLTGSDPRATGEVIIISAHLDHLGVREAASGDKIFNGADDDASGCVAVLELARVLASGRRPRRTIYFVCFGSEESGGHGSRYFIDNSPVPLERIAANIQFEMLGRPDPKVPPNSLWLTGYERSNLGPQLARQGAPLVADPHPEQNFFRRSDNYVLALRGVVAHTVSSFGLHTDYHQPSDDVSKIDFPYMTQSINSLIGPIRWLANSTFRPAWLPGQQPSRN